MKFVLAIGLQVILGLLLMFGIIQAVHGNLWLLVIGGLAYLVIFARAGCATH